MIGPPHTYSVSNIIHTPYITYSQSPKVFAVSDTHSYWKSASNFAEYKPHYQKFKSTIQMSKLNFNTQVQHSGRKGRRTAWAGKFLGCTRSRTHEFI
jgi:hypothetical protein